MKRFIIFIFMSYLVLSNIYCNSVTGEVIDDYNRAKNPIARLVQVPEAVVTLDEVARNGNAVTVPVGGSEITRYRYRINRGAWSQVYDVFLPVTIANPECGSYTLDVIGSITDRFWQPYNMPTTCSWQVVPGRASLKDVSVFSGADNSYLELAPAFESHADGFTATASPDVRRVVVSYQEFDGHPLKSIAYRVGEYGESQDLEGGRYVFLVDGINDIYIDCTGSDGSVQTYKLVVNRRVREWMEPENISGAGNIMITSKVRSVLASDIKGNVGVVWTHKQDTNTNVMMNTYTDNMWGGKSVIATSIGEYGHNSRIQYDNQGNAYIMWLENVPSVDEISVCMATINGDTNRILTEKPERIKGQSLVDFNFKLRQDCLHTYLQSGIVIQQGDATSSCRTLANRRVDDDWIGFVNPTGNNYRSRHFSFDLDKNGNAVYVYTQYINSKCNIYARIYDAEHDWHTVDLLQQDTGACDPVVRYDYTGNAIAVWGKFNNSMNDLDYYACRYIKDRGWSVPEKINRYTQTEGADEIQLAISLTGDAIAVWHQRVNDGNRNIWVNHYDVDNDKWLGAKVLSPIDNTLSEDPIVAFDNNGDAVVVWTLRKDSQYGIASCKYQQSIGWSEYQTIFPCKNENMRGKQMVVNSNNDIVLIWNQKVGSEYVVMSSIYR